MAIVTLLSLGGGAAKGMHLNNTIKHMQEQILLSESSICIRIALLPHSVSILSLGYCLYRILHVLHVSA